MSSQPSKQKAEQFVVPGERLGVIEEFVPDSGTFVKDGVIFSRVVGRALVDPASKRVSVYPLAHGAKVPTVGNTVIGQVSNVQSDNAAIRISNVDEKPLSGVFSGILHISDVSPRYVESMFDVCKPGDILRAVVISSLNRVYHLSTKERDLGVVYAFCSNCGNVLEARRQIMHCPRCGRIEKRKTSFGYGKEES